MQITAAYGYSMAGLDLQVEVDLDDEQEEIVVECIKQQSRCSTSGVVVLYFSGMHRYTDWSPGCNSPWSG